MIFVKWSRRQSPATKKKGTQNTLLHSVKARADKGFRGRATFYEADGEAADWIAGLGFTQ